MKSLSNTIIVVEGTTDVAFLQSFIQSEFVITNGSDVPCETISYLLKAQKTKQLIVLTDPDFPGKRIRDVLEQEGVVAKHVFIEKRHCIRNNKVGIAESNKEVILEALANIRDNDIGAKGNWTSSDLIEMQLIGAPTAVKRRQILAERLHIGHTNGKTLLKRLNSLNITPDEVKKALE